MRSPIGSAAEFKKLQAAWYLRLREIGFDDIESKGIYARPDVDRRTWRRACAERESRIAYFALADEFLRSFRFQKPRHRDAWELHAQGLSVRQIAKDLGLTRNQVGPLIARLRRKLKVVSMDGLKLRPMARTDVEYVKGSWLKNYKNSSSFAKRVTHDVFYKWHGAIVDAILSRPGTDVFIATLPDEEGVILGFFVCERQGQSRVAHYLFVRPEWRKLGLARALIGASEETAFVFTHWTKPMDSIVNRKDIALVYDPYRLLRMK